LIQNQPIIYQLLEDIITSPCGVIFISHDIHGKKNKNSYGLNGQLGYYSYLTWCHNHMLICLQSRVVLISAICTVTCGDAWNDIYRKKIN
jgi:hypothetical protein